MVCCLAGGPAARAGTDVWNGGGGTDPFWHTGANWVSGAFPAIGDNLIFSNTVSLAPSNNYTAGTSFNSINFATPAGAFTLNGRSVTLTGGITNRQAFTLQTINLPLIVNTPVSINTVDNSALNLNGAISGASGLTMTGNGTVSLNAVSSNAFAGPLEVDGGVIIPAADLSLGTTNDLGSFQAGRLVLNNGTLNASANLTINANRGIAVGPISGAGWGGLSVNTGGTLKYGGVIADNGGSGGLTKSGYGVLSLFGANTYSGPTTNLIGTLLLDFTQPLSPSSDIINSSSSLVLGGGNAGGGSENVAQLIAASSGSGHSQTFAGTFATFGGSAIVATNTSGGSINLALGTVSHEPGGTLTFVTPASTGFGDITTTAGNVNGVLGGWALISGDGNGASTFVDTGHTLLLGTNLATVDLSGNIVNFTGYSNVTAAAGTLAGQITGSPQPPNVSIDDTAASSVVTVDTDLAGTTTDVNAIKWTTAGGGFDGIFIGHNNTLRLGQYGAIIRNGPSTGNAVYIGGSSSAAQSGSGTRGANDIGILTAGGAPNTAGEINIVANNPSETTGTTIFEPTITDNGSGAVTVVKMGPGSIKLDGRNSYSGGLYLLQGRVQFASSEVANLGDTNAQAGGTGPIFVLPGAYLFPSGIGTNYITNALFIAGAGDAHEPLGATRGGNYSGPVTLVGDATIGGNANFVGAITGPFALTLGSPATVNGGAMLGSTDDAWTGDTIMIARSNTGANTVINSNNEVIPNGFGNGNVTLQGFSTGRIFWNLNGFNETINGLSTAGTSSTCVITNGVTGSTSTLTVGDNDQSGAFGGSINNGAGAIALTKVGAGIETLTRANTYAGDTTISDGVLQLTGSGAINSSPNVNINGGTFDVSQVGYTIPATQSVNANGGTFEIASAGSNGGSITLNNGTLQLDQVTLSANYNGPLTLAGSQNVIHLANIPRQGDWPHTFPIIHYTTLTGNMNTLLGEFPTAAYQGYFSNDLATSTIFVVITNGPITPSIVWSGSVNGDWDIFTTDNWLIGASATNYTDGDIVYFLDNGANRTINITTDVNPGDTYVSNTVAYAFTGTGGIAGTNRFIKEGAGTLTLDNNGINSFSGGLTVSAGTVQIGNNDAGATTFGSGPIGNDGALVFNSQSTFTVAQSVSGAGSLTQEGSGGTVTLNGANSFDGTVTITNGSILQAGNDAALGTTNNGTTIYDGSALDLNGHNLGAEPVTVTGAGLVIGGVTNGAIYNSGGQPITRALSDVTLSGDTVFGGASRWDIGSAAGTSGNPATAHLNGAYNVVKTGPNFFGIVSATVDPALGNIDVQAGTLDFEGNTTGLGNSSATLFVRNGATLELFSATNLLNKQVQMGDTSSDTTSLVSGSGNNIIVGPIALTGAIVVSVTNGTLMLSNSLTGSGSLNKNNTGSLILAGSDSHSGGITVNDGALVLNITNNNTTDILTVNGSQTASPVPVVVGGNGTFRGAADIEDTLWPGVSGKPSTLNIGSGSDWVDPTTGNDAFGALALGGLGGSGKAIFSLNTAATTGSGVNDFVTVNGNLNPNFGSVLVNPLSPLTAGNTYTLVTYSGSLVSTFGSANVLSSLRPSRYQFSLTQGSGVVSLTVNTGPGALKWNNAATTGIWDLTNSVNWLNTVGGTNDYFAQLDTVTFDDTYLAGPTNSVTVGATVMPGSITVNTANTYTFSGSGKITGSTGLEKDGTGALSVGNTGNDFAGSTAINAGSLVVNAANALGSTASSVTVASGATLDVGGPSFARNTATILGAKPIIVSGTGVGGNGAIINSSAVGQQNAVQNVTLVGDTAFGGPGDWHNSSTTPGRWDIRGGNATLSTGGNPYNLYKVGSNQVSLVGVNVDSNLANIDIQGGELGIETSSTLGDPNATLTVEAGAVLEFFGATTTNRSKHFVLHGDGASTNLWNNNGNTTLFGTMTLTNGDVVVRVNSGSLTNNCIIDGDGGLVKVDGQPLVLTADNTYTGNTTIGAGSLILLGNGAITTSPNLILGGGTLDVASRNDNQLALNSAVSQKLSGQGTINGTLVSGAGTTVAPGSLATVGVINVTTNADLSGSTVLKLNAGALTNDSVNVSGNLTIGGTLTLTNLSGALAGGQSFKLFNAATYTTNYTAIVPSTPGANLAWDVTMLASNGTLAVVSTGPPPTPHITGISLTGATLTLTATNGSAGSAYVLLQSTNVALPLAQWTPVLTNNFDGNGNLNLSTNVVDPGNQQNFYILQAP